MRGETIASTIANRAALVSTAITGLEWDPWIFEGPWSARWVTGDPGGARFVLPEDESRQLGAQLNVWNDDPGNMSQGDIAAGIAPRLRILAQKTWGSPELTDRYAEFEALAGP